MVNKILETTKKKLKLANLWKTKSNILVGVSGGIDSVMLLYSLYALKKEGAYNLSVCHVNHGLREKTAKRDENVVIALCKQLNIPCIVKNANLNGTMQDNGAETKARNARIKIFKDILREIDGNALLTAHHQNDQAETVLMHLLRGSGSKGAIGIKFISPFYDYIIVRPFLTISKETLTTAIVQLNLPYVHDESNDCLITPRNILRNDIFPKLENIFPCFQSHIVNYSNSVALDEDFLENQTEKLYKTTLINEYSIFAFRIKPLLESYECLQRRVFIKGYNYLIKLLPKIPTELSLSHKECLELINLIYASPNKTCNLQNNLLALRGKNHIHIIKQDKSPLFPVYNNIFLSLNPNIKEFDIKYYSFILEKNTSIYSEKKQHYNVYLSNTLIKKNICFREIRKDDWIIPFGKKSPRPLRRILIDAKIDFPFRSGIIVLALENEVLWVPGVLTSETTRIAGNNAPFNIKTINLLPWDN